MKRLSLLLAFSLLVVSAKGAAQAVAEDCTSYPLRRGSTFDAVKGSPLPRIVSTAIAVPFSEDAGDVDDAFKEATLVAKTEIAKYMAELVKSGEVRNRVIDRLESISGEGRRAAADKVNKITETYSSNSEALLRGVVVLGDCYTPGKEVRVTVGFKPETLATAIGLADSMGRSSSGQSSTDGGSAAAAPSSREGPLRRPPGHSNKSRLESF